MHQTREGKHGVKVGLRRVSREAQIICEDKNLTDHLEIRERPKVKAKKPIIILTNQSMIEGESRKITETGIFLACKEKLPKNETYTMAIRVSQKESVIVKGELMWSNLDSLRLGSPLSDVGMCFIKILDEDRHLFNHKVIERLEGVK
jgi:hypothetical protein